MPGVTLLDRLRISTSPDRERSQEGRESNTWDLDIALVISGLRLLASPHLFPGSESRKGAGGEHVIDALIYSL